MAQMIVWSIYRLYHPLREKDTCYIGITSQSLEKRLTSHLQYHGPNRELVEWIQALHSQGITPSISEIEQMRGTRTQAEKRERIHIWQSLASGHPLLNRAHIPGNTRLFAEYLQSHVE